ncbi:hypothetical protein N7462_002355 [Penicillium macrosclerotiorum]|uniref:uncharacterized protein n=1 Tax=Penicillium macrosclerotiorum TaxID=303699 RepID=UPI00254707E5|nr:uncharacterized protein N7462_002355 [Penicillium macrosclerotiorum]KAJ5692932.1 hypothetical protein N7462_002355 [Penicillium macrosclerotiorum]
MSLASPPASLAPRTWTREGSDFFISNNPALLSVKAVNEAFGRDFIYWGKPFPEDVMRQMLHGSMSFGVYRRLQPQPESQAQRQNIDLTATADNTEQVGLARIVTDGCTFGYVTDVYVLPEYQGHGLGKWLFDCVAEIFSKENMPHLRRIMLLTNEPHMQNFYAKIFGMKVVGSEPRPDTGRDLVFMCARPQTKPMSEEK